MIFNQTFKNKKIIVTGHTGFKGSWLITWLNILGADVYGISLESISSPSHFTILSNGLKIDDNRFNILDQNQLNFKFNAIKPDFVFHLAAQAIVRTSYDNPIDTWKTNVIGTLNVLEALRGLKNKCSAIIITSDKCYDNVEWIWGYREHDSLGGPDPYSASKGAAELLIKSHYKSYFSEVNSNIRIASVRAGNVIGGGDWSENRIIPDCVRAWSQNKVVELRNPNATRPWQHVLEPLSGYLLLACELSSNYKLNGESFNFGPMAENNHTVISLVIEMSKNWDKVKWEDVSSLFKGPYESGLLKLNCDKALAILNWKAVLNFEETIQMTSLWYNEYYTKPSMNEKFTVSQINEYIFKAKIKGLKWAQ